MIGAIVLAAGGSTRLGYAKQLVVDGGEPLVRKVARAASEAGARPIVVVLGASSETIAEALTGLPVQIVVNGDWESGLASSLACGVRALMQDRLSDGMLVLLADQPRVDTAAISRLMANFDVSRRIVATAHGEALGVPAIFGREYATELMQLEGDRGASGWLARHSAEVTSVYIEGVHLDVDTPSDVRRLLDCAERSAKR